MKTTLSARDELKRVLFNGSDISAHLDFLTASSIGNVMEIGVRQGASTSAMLAGIEIHGGHLWSVDINDCNIFPDHPDWTFIRANSVKDADKIKSLIPEILDFLLIDGDHKYDAVISDLENYGDRAKVIALHDAQEYGVLTAISDYCYRNELTYTVRPKSYGLGIITR